LSRPIACSSRLACEVVSEAPRAFASPFWTFGNLRISIRESIPRDHGSAKDLFAAIGTRKSKALAPPMVWSRRGQKMANCPRSPVVGFSRLSDGLPEIFFRRTPRNARFRRDVAVRNMTLWSQNSLVGPLLTRSGRSLQPMQCRESDVKRTLRDRDSASHPESGSPDRCERSDAWSVLALDTREG
jgi:hypothetical protein